MFIQPTLDSLNRLKLHGMAAAFSEQMTQSAASGLAFEDRLGLLVEHEALYRDNRRLARLLQLAQLKVRATLEDVDFHSRRGLDRAENREPWILRLDSLSTESSDSRCHRLRQDLSGVRAGQPGVPSRTLGAVRACTQALRRA